MLIATRKEKILLSPAQSFKTSPMHGNLFLQSFAAWLIRVKLIPNILHYFNLAKVVSHKNDTKPKTTVNGIENACFCGSRIWHAKRVPDDRAETCVR